MAKGAKKRKIPTYGRKEAHVAKDLGLHTYSSDVPLGNTDPTMVRGVMYGGVPNAPKRATGKLRTYKGRY